MDNIGRRIVGAMFPPSIFEYRCRPSKIDVSTFEDRCVDLRRSIRRPSRIDGRCEIMLLYTLAQNIDTINI